ncbi:MAG: hypothetical protein NT027_14770 [Proteobacteria bacterium]|nr:hypothetical protein [Pseudomonadota bacterium]
METFPVSNAVIERLAAKVEALPERFSFTSDPAIAELCSCIGIAFEIGKKEYDRLSLYLGIELNEGVEGNPYQTRVVKKHGHFGLVISRNDGFSLKLAHKDFLHLLGPESVWTEDGLKELVIFPHLVAQTYRDKGFELVIVRDWLLQTALCHGQHARVNYIFANEWEIKSNIASLQARLILSKQLPFFGTHDIVDHLFDADSSGIDRNIFSLVNRCMVQMERENHKDAFSLRLSYFVAVLLDDLAQPKQYCNTSHKLLVRASLAALDTYFSSRQMTESKDFKLPSEFHELISLSRRNSASPNELIGKFAGMLMSIAC